MDCVLPFGERAHVWFLLHSKHQTEDERCDGRHRQMYLHVSLQIQNVTPVICASMISIETSCQQSVKVSDSDSSRVGPKLFTGKFNYLLQLDY